MCSRKIAFIFSLTEHFDTQFQTPNIALIITSSVYYVYITLLSFWIYIMSSITPEFGASTTISS
jgi:hypothetical protein